MEAKLNGKYNAKIKCTYLELFDEKRNKVFSLQKARFPGVVGTFDSNKATIVKDTTRSRLLVPITITPDVRNILETYTKRYLSSPAVKETGVKNPLKDTIENSYFVNYSSVKWLAQLDTGFGKGDYTKPNKDDDQDPDVEPDQEPKKKSNVKLALAAAALLTFLS